MQFNLEEFKTKEIVIHCNTEAKADKLLEYLHNKNIKWSDGEELLNNTEYIRYKNQTCYSYRPDFGGVVLCEYDFYKINNYTIISFNELVFN